MNNVIQNFENCIGKTNFGLINFEYLIAHPEYVCEVWNKYSYDQSFRQKVNEKIKIDQVFKLKFYRIFKTYIENSKVNKTK